MDKRKKAFIMFATYCILLITPKITKKDKDNVQINTNYSKENILPFANYNQKRIYIGSDKQIELIKNSESDDIYIIDRRNSNNPTMSICNSYKINNSKEISIILDIINEYEEIYSTDWDRTKNSMKNEWLVHNLCYMLNYEPFRTEQVDLDNNDEVNYQNIIQIFSKFDEIIQNETNSKTYRLKK